MMIVSKRFLRDERKSSIRVGYEQQRINNGRLGKAIEFVATAELVILAEGVDDAAYGGVEVFNVGLGEWDGWLRTGGNCTGQAELWRSERGACGSVDAEERGNGWIDHAGRASCGSGGSAASGTGRAFGDQEVGDIGLTDDVLAAEDKITECRGLIAAKEESLVVDEGSADSAAKLIALDAIGSGGRGKVILSVEDRIANEFEGVSMEIVCAGLGDDVDDAARIGAVLRAVVPGFEAGFLQATGSPKG